ncbi:MAG TPA: N-acetyl-gamma-glutamyl-phosphate reductase [Candidatus Dormibacteraeota bacterium]|nr:N-acetyl-gamma-glutamyl-phosphate reductase [Candidatus Dormibacteraeota bacterium]
MIRVSVVGGAGYVGGELVRLVLGHPQLTLAQVTSSSHQGRPVASVHPNLRGFTEQRFADPADLQPCDAVLVANTTPGRGPSLVELRQLAGVVVDCGPQLRLRDPRAYRSWYPDEPAPEELLAEAVYGLPEMSRSQLRGSTLASGAGCSATATILALLPAVRSGWVLTAPACVEARFGSSAAGAQPTSASHHPERSGAVRVFAPEGHRHQAEVAQALGWDERSLSYSGVAIEMVRGISVSVRCFLARPVTESQVWEAFRSAYREEPFIRVVTQRRGLHRYPDPRWLAGTNLCDVGFALDRSGERLTLLAALDNLGKGAAGNAVQTLNCMLGLEERSGLGFMGLHPL